jgi:hypothetical protein
MLRPRPIVLEEAALVPPHRLIKPPPNQFTHEVREPQPYYYDRTDASPDGQFAAGAHVVLIRHDGDPHCFVIDSRGLCVVTPFAGLRRL